MPRRGRMQMRRAPRGYGRGQPQQKRSFFGPRFWIGAGLIGFAFLSYQCSTEYNPVTGEEQHIAMAPQQEIALGMKAVPEMVQQYGGLYPDQEAQALVDRIGNKVVQESDAAGTGWQFDFYLLADPRTVNAIALPGGPIGSPVTIERPSFNASSRALATLRCPPAVTPCSLPGTLASTQPTSP